MVLLLVALNIVGVKEAAGLNIFLALADLATQGLLVVIGLFVVFSPDDAGQQRRTWARSPTWSNFIVAIPVAMVAYTGIETVSNMAEEAIDPARHVPRAIMYVVLAVFAIYAFLPSVALSAMPVQPATRRWWPTPPSPIYPCPKQVTWASRPRPGLPLRRRPGRGAGARISGCPRSSSRGSATTSAILAATILIIATNAGIIGVSRLTYSMGQHRQLPEPSAPRAPAVQHAVRGDRRSSA